MANDIFVETDRMVSQTQGCVKFNSELLSFRQAVKHSVESAVVFRPLDADCGSSYSERKILVTSLCLYLIQD